MSASKELTVLAAELAAGDYTVEQLHELLGDDDLVATVIKLSGALAGGMIAGQATKHVIDQDIFDSTFETADEVIDAINPFNW